MYQSRRVIDVVSGGPSDYRHQKIATSGSLSPSPVVSFTRWADIVLFLLVPFGLYAVVNRFEDALHVGILWSKFNLASSVTIAGLYVCGANRVISLSRRIQFRCLCFALLIGLVAMFLSGRATLRSGSLNWEVAENLIWIAMIIIVLGSKRAIAVLIAVPGRAGQQAVTLVSRSIVSGILLQHQQFPDNSLTQLNNPIGRGGQANCPRITRHAIHFRSGSYFKRRYLIDSFR
jgi:hypothetical protein